MVQVGKGGFFLGKRSETKCEGARAGIERHEGSVPHREPEMEELWTALSEFSQQYETTGKMPTARQLRDAGRQDLVDAIKAKGGFFFVGYAMQM